MRNRFALFKGEAGSSDPCGGPVSRHKIGRPPTDHFASFGWATYAQRMFTTSSREVGCGIVHRGFEKDVDLEQMLQFDFQHLARPTDILAETE